MLPKSPRRQHLLYSSLRPRQYSSDSKMQVDEQSASVIIQILTRVILSVYTDISRNPCQVKVVLLPVVSVNSTPITGLMARKVSKKVVARYPNRFEGTGRRDQATKGEEALHTVPFVFSRVGLATGVSGTAGTPFARVA